MRAEDTTLERTNIGKGRENITSTQSEFSDLSLIDFFYSSFKLGSILIIPVYAPLTVDCTSCQEPVYEHGSFLPIPTW
jgi:hypothetical protein